MKYSLLEKLDIYAVTRLIEEARVAELRRDIIASQAIFSPIWANIEEEPNFTDFNIAQQANLYRLAGFFLSLYGKTKNLRFYQERGKNLITKAIELFTYLNETKNVAEANVMLALCYYYEGGVNECELILEQTKEDFDSDTLHPVYLQICINRSISMIVKKEYQEAFDILNQIKVSMDFCQDNRMCSLFNEKLGMTYKYTGEFDKAIYHYNQSISYAQDSNNYIFLTINKNNLANLYRETADFELAHSIEDEAIELAKQYELNGWLPHFLDTKALIYFDQRRFDLALETISEAISIFQQGEDANGLTEALWNKCKFLLHLERKEEAILLFNEMIPIAAQQMGEFAVKGFVKEFAKLIHIRQNGTLGEEIKRFKKAEIVNAILEAKEDLHKAAALLKISLKTLTKILDNEFPELFKELNLLRQSNVEQNFEIVETKSPIPRNISELRMDKTKFRFEIATPQNVKTFYFSAEKMQENFAIDNDSVVAILPIDKISANEYILVENLLNNLYSFGKVNYDSSLDLFYLFENDEPMPISPNEFKLIGNAFAFCPFDEIDEDELRFRNFNF